MLDTWSEAKCASWCSILCVSREIPYIIACPNPLNSIWWKLWETPMTWRPLQRPVCWKQWQDYFIQWLHRLCVAQRCHLMNGRVNMVCVSSIFLVAAVYSKIPSIRCHYNHHHHHSHPQHPWINQNQNCISSCNALSSPEIIICDCAWVIFINSGVGWQLRCWICSLIFAI